MDTKEGENKIYKIAKARQRSRQDKQSVNIIKDEHGIILVDEEAIKTRWKTYFEELLNVENDKDELEEPEQVEGPEMQILRSEVEMAVKHMKNNKAPGPSGITSEMLKGVGDVGIDWLYEVLNDFCKQEKLPDDLKISEIIPIFKQKGDVMECGNYRGIKLLETVLKLLEKILERRLRKVVEINRNQFGFMPGRGTTDAVFILRQIQEKILEGNKKRYWTFVDLEKAFDRVPRDVVYWSLRKKGVTEKMIRIIKAMYDGARTVVKTSNGNTDSFEIKVGVHQGSCLSPLLFIIVMDVVSEYVRKDLPWDMLYADDLNIATETSTDAQTRLTKWQQALERAGLRVNASKTETMVCAKIQEKVDIMDCHGKRLNQVDCFKYLGSTITATGGCETDVKCRIKAAWCKWKELSGVVCDKRMPIWLKGKVYKTMIRPVLMYGSETWALRRKEEQLIQRTEMRMLRWITGVTLKDKIRSEDIRLKTGVADVKDKIKESRLRWYGHVKRSGDDSFLKNIMDAEVRGRRSQGRQRKRWIDLVRQDMKTVGIKDEDAQRRSLWRRSIHVADPSAVRDTTA